MFSLHSRLWAMVWVVVLVHCQQGRYNARLSHGAGIMIEVLKSDEIVRKVGGRFKLTALIQRRWQELIDGARPLVEREGRSDLELAIAEIMEDKIMIDYESSDVTDPETALD